MQTTTDPYGGWTPPPSPPPPASGGGPSGPDGGSGQRVLRRSRTDRVGAGVAGGLGEYFDVDPVIFRVLFATSAFFGGIGAIAYLLAWLAIPDRSATGTERAAIDRWVGELRRRRVPVWVVAVVGGLVVWGVGFSWWTPHPFFPLIVVAIILAVALSRRGPNWRSPTSTAAPARSPADEVPAGPVDLTKPLTPTDPVGPDSGWDDNAPGWAAETRRWMDEAREASRERRRRARPVRGAVLGALLATLLVLGICDAVGGILLPVYFWVLGGIVVLGLAVGLVLRRTPWSLSALLVPAVIGVVAFGGSRASLHDGFGQRQWTPTTAVESSYRLAFGQGVLDLRNLVPSDAPRRFDVVIAAGQARILLPASMNATVNADVHAGQIEVDGTQFGQHHSDRSGGYDLSHVVLPPAGATGAAVTIDVHLADGQISVQHLD